MAEGETVRMEGLLVADAAIEELQKALDEQKEKDSKESHVRVAVRGGGCSGFEYHLAIEAPEDLDPSLDTIEDHKGVKIVIDKKSLLYLDGTTLNWVDELSKRGFKFENPLATKTCGCGSSFSC